MNGAASRLIGSAAVLLVRDVVAAANHYRDAMGFAYERFYGEPPGFVILSRDNMDLMLKRVDDAKLIVANSRTEKNLWNVYFWVSDVDALYAEFVGRGAKIDYGLCDQDYGCREFGIQDLDGYVIGFGQVVGPDRA